VARTIITKLLLVIPVLLLVSLGTFFMVDLVPGNIGVEVLGGNATAADYARVNDQLGFNKPVLERYWSWLDKVLHGNLGQNLVPPIENVSTRLARAFPINLELAVLALAMAFIIALPLAMWSAYRIGGRFDRFVSAATFGTISVPSFLVGLLLVLIFAVNWHIFPLGQWARPTARGWATNLHYAFLPALTLALAEASVYIRLLRSDMAATLQEDYILAARAKGMPTWHILLREALRPSSFSLITLAGLSVGRLIGGTIIVEQIFSLPGVGSVVINAAQKNDYTLVQGGVLIIAVIYILVNLVVDILYGYLDPRIRRAQV
jgi:peptide/nickel transport system permease protein